MKIPNFHPLDKSEILRIIRIISAMKFRGVTFPNKRGELLDFLEIYFHLDENQDAKINTIIQLFNSFVIETGTAGDALTFRKFYFYVENTIK